MRAAAAARPGLAALFRRGCALSAPAAPRALAAHPSRGLCGPAATAWDRPVAGPDGGKWEWWKLPPPVWPPQSYGEAGSHKPRPNFSRAARRARLEAALSACAEGHPFEMPKPELTTTPGPVGAVMNILRDSPLPLKTAEVWEQLQERYPGVIKSKNHLKRRILMDALVHRLTKVAVDGPGSQKDRWTLKRRGATRMAMARKKGQSSKKRLRYGPRGKFHTRHAISRAR